MKKIMKIKKDYDINISIQYKDTEKTGWFDSSTCQLYKSSRDDKLYLESFVPNLEYENPLELIDEMVGIIDLALEKLEAKYPNLIKE